MRSQGFTLIEILVVISIISILAVVGFVNFKDSVSDQKTSKAIGEIQTLLRLAQSNATSSTICNGQGATSWSLKFSNQTTLELRCQPNDYLKSSQTLENAQIAFLIGSNSCPVDLATTPFTVTYKTGAGAFAVSYSGSTPTCLASDNWTFTVNTKTLILSRGGAIDVGQ